MLKLCRKFAMVDSSLVLFDSQGLAASASIHTYSLCTEHWAELSVDATVFLSCYFYRALCWL